MNRAEEELIAVAADLSDAQRNLKQQAFKSNKSTVDKFAKGKGKQMTGMMEVSYPLLLLLLLLLMLLLLLLLSLTSFIFSVSCILTPVKKSSSLTMLIQLLTVPKQIELQKQT